MSVGKALGGGVPVGAALVSEEVADDDLVRRPRQHLRRQPARVPRGARASSTSSSAAACSRTSAASGTHFEQRLRAHGRQAPDRQGGARRRPDVGPRADARRGAGRAGRRSTRGVIVNRTAETVVRLLPPLVITEAEVDEALGRLDAALGAVPERGRMNDQTGRITLRTADAVGRADAARAHHGQSRGGPSAAAHARRADASTPRASSSRCAAGRSSAAPSSRRSARTSPRCARSPSTPARAAAASARRLVDELRRRARREGFDKLCAFTHAPGYFMPDGLLDRAAPLAAGEDLHRLREVPALPPLRPVRDGACRSTRRRRRSTATRRRRPARMTAPTVAALETIAGGVTTPRGFRAAGVSAGIKANGGLDLALLVSDTPATAAARLHDEPGAGRAGPRLARASARVAAASARAIVVNSGCANACTGDDGLRVARDMAAETARLVGCPRRAGARRLDRRHRRRAADRQDPARRCPRPFARARRRSGRRWPRTPS